MLRKKSDNKFVNLAKFLPGKKFHRKDRSCILFSFIYITYFWFHLYLYISTRLLVGSKRQGHHFYFQRVHEKSKPS